MVTKVTGKNQVTVPAEVAKKAGIRVGTYLEWRQTDRDGILEVRVLPDRGTRAASLRSAGRRYLKRGRHPIENLIREREQEATERDRK